MGIGRRWRRERSTTVRADEIVVGDVVVLPTADGDVVRRVDAITVRASTIKFVSRRAGGGDWGWGWAPDAPVQRVSRGRGG